MLIALLDLLRIRARVERALVDAVERVANAK